MEKVAYGRQSVEKKNSLSIEGQLALCEKAAGEPLKVYQDRGYSGKNTERPDFKRLLKDIQADKISHLYVYRLDRFSRSVADFGRLWEILRAHNVEFISVSENFDTSTPMGRAMLHIIMVFAQLERETTAERVRDNYYRRASLGSWPGGPAPYGFTVGRACDRSGRVVPTLTANDQAEVVLRIFRAYAEEDASLGSVAKDLNRDGIPAPRRATWDNVSLSRLLHNPAYAMADEQVFLHYKGLGVNVISPQEDFDGCHGVLLVGKRDRAAKKYTEVQGHSASVLNSLGIVPADLWLECQNKLQRNQQIGNSGKGTHTWLSGLLKCAKCGYSLKVLHQKEYRYLICSGRYNLSHCNAVVRVSITELETVVAAQIEALLQECPEEPQTALPVDSYAAKLEELDRRADRLMDAFAESCDLSPDYLHRALSRLETERQTLLEARKRESNRPVLPDKLVFRELDFEEKKAVATQFIRRIDVGENDVEICWNV